EIRRVAYDHESFARRCESLGIADVFVSPLRTGVWTIGVASLPAGERHRPLRRGDAHDAGWRPELLQPDRFPAVLAAFRDMRLVSAAESDQVMHLFSPNFPLFAAARLADSIHLHVKVDDVAALPLAKIEALGTRAENARDGYVKFSFAGGINMIFSSI